MLPNPIASNRPVTIGHRYSTLVYYPEKLSLHAPPWVVPLSTRRIRSSDKEVEVSAEQIETLCDDETLPFKENLCVSVVDSTLSASAFLGRVAEKENLVTIARLRGNRVLYRLPDSECKKDSECKRGHPRWYGARVVGAPISYFDAKAVGTLPAEVQDPTSTPGGQPGNGFFVRRQGDTQGAPALGALSLKARGAAIYLCLRRTNLLLKTIFEGGT